MSIISDINSILVNIKFPLNLQLINVVIRDGENVEVEPFLEGKISGGKSIRFILNLPFLYSTRKGSVLVTDMALISQMALQTKFEVQEIYISERLELIIKSTDVSLVGYPGLSYGWGMYVDDIEVFQHYGWTEGVEVRKITFD